MKRAVLLALMIAPTLLPAQAVAGPYVSPFVVFGGDSCNEGCNMDYEIEKPSPTIGATLGWQGGRSFVYGLEAQLSNAEVGASAYIGAGAGGLQVLAGVVNVALLEAHTHRTAQRSQASDAASAVGPFAEVSFSGFFTRWAQYDADFSLTTAEITGVDSEGRATYGTVRTDDINVSIDRYMIGYRFKF